MWNDPNSKPNHKSKPVTLTTDFLNYSRRDRTDIHCSEFFQLLFCFRWNQFAIPIPIPLEIFFQRIQSLGQLFVGLRNTQFSTFTDVFGWAYSHWSFPNKNIPDSQLFFDIEDLVKRFILFAPSTKTHASPTQTFTKMDTSFTKWSYIFCRSIHKCVNEKFLKEHETQIKFASNKRELLVSE